MSLKYQAKIYHKLILSLNKNFTIYIHKLNSKIHKTYYKLSRTTNSKKKLMISKKKNNHRSDQY
jgi:hypothetical protein